MYTPLLLLHLVHGGREMSAELIELSNALAQVTERAASSVVAIHAEARGSSSGVVWGEGVIVTAEHALRRDEEIQVTLPDGRVVPATLAGRDPFTDLAVLKCAGAGNHFIERGYLGVALQPVRLPEQLRQSIQHKEKTAAIILEVEPDGPAHKAGIVIGDILISLAGHPISRPENVQSHLQSENIGKSLAAKILRGGAVRDVSIAVGDRANEGE